MYADNVVCHVTSHIKSLLRDCFYKSRKSVKPQSMFVTYTQCDFLYIVFCTHYFFIFDYICCLLKTETKCHILPSNLMNKKLLNTQRFSIIRRNVPIPFSIILFYSLVKHDERPLSSSTKLFFVNAIIDTNVIH